MAPPIEAACFNLLLIVMNFYRSLDEISSLDARDLFQKFVELWNSKQLSMMYYDGKTIRPVGGGEGVN